MGERVELVIDPIRRERVAVDLPLRFRVPVAETLSSLGLDGGVDLDDPIVAKAVGLAGAAARWPGPVPFVLFGGTAVRLTCPISNRSEAGLRHELHDLDVAVRSKELSAFIRFLSGVARSEGSALTFFEAPGDRIFNSLGGGRRLRWHMVVSETGGEVVLGTVDIVADTFEFCHRFDLRAEVENGPRQGWALSPTLLLLTKAQFLQRIPAGDAERVPERVVEPYGKREVVIGPEAKDVRDLFSVLHDHPRGTGPGRIDLGEIRRRVAEDWGLWKTLALNLGMAGRSPILDRLAPDVRQRILGALAAVRDAVASEHPKPRRSLFGGPWWQEVDTTPPVDSTVRRG